MSVRIRPLESPCAAPPSGIRFDMRTKMPRLRLRFIRQSAHSNSALKVIAQAAANTDGQVACPPSSSMHPHPKGRLEKYMTMSTMNAPGQISCIFRLARGGNRHPALDRMPGSVLSSLALQSTSQLSHLAASTAARLHQAGDSSRGSLIAPPSSKSSSRHPLTRRFPFSASRRPQPPSRSMSAGKSQRFQASWVQSSSR
jgi:hypothetical protein